MSAVIKELDDCSVETAKHWSSVHSQNTTHQVEYSPLIAIFSSPILLGFSYLHCFPPQNMEHCIAPGARCRRDSDKREYFGPASFSSALDARWVHLTCPLLLFDIVKRWQAEQTAAFSHVCECCAWRRTFWFPGSSHTNTSQLATTLGST